MSTIAPSSTLTAADTDNSLDGKLVQVSGQPAVYLVVNGDACWVETPDVYEFLFGNDWKQIQYITQEQLDALHAGPAIGTRVYVATTTGSYPYWLIDGRKHLFGSEAVFNAYPFVPGCIETVSQTVLDGYKQGFTIRR